VLANGTAAHAVFTRLGPSELPLSSKALFCLCEGSPQYGQLLSSYTSTLEWMRFPFEWLPFFLLAYLPLLICFCMFCPILIRLQDVSRYYDKDLV